MFSFMSKRKSRPRWDARRRRYLANPLWPLEELRDLFHNPPIVADPEFTSFKIKALRRDLQAFRMARGDVRPVRWSANPAVYCAKREFAIPALVAGLPWRYDSRQINPVPVPEGELTRIDLSYIASRPQV